MENGKAYYVISHAYYHYLVIVEASTPNRVKTSRTVQIRSSDMGWTELFAKGVGKGRTTYEILTPGWLTVINAFEWPHPIPESKKDSR